MSEMQQDIQIDLFLPNIKACSQKQLLNILVKHVAPLTFQPEKRLLKGLEEKEATSTFAIGDGIIVPNLQLMFIPKPFKALCTLKKPVDLGAADKRAIDTVCLVLSPLHEGPLHLRRLARMSRLLKNQNLRRALRDAPDAKSMKATLEEPQSIMLAA
jgi:nitrogen PTS system EIIA component